MSTAARTETLTLAAALDVLAREIESDWEGTIAQFRGDRYGLADRLDRTDAIRNGQVPDVAALAWLLLSGAAYQGGRVEHPNTK